MKKKILFFLAATMLSGLSVFAQVDENGILYSLYTENLTAEVMHIKECTDNIVIPNTLNYDGKNYSVTGIGEKSFSECGMSSILIPNSVTSIRMYAFAFCYNLTSITILNPVPINIEPDVFLGVDISKCTLIVPANAGSAYQKADVWKEFEIKEGDVVKEEKEDIVVMKDDVIVFRTAIADVDSIIFYDPVSPAVLPSSTEALLIQQADVTSIEEIFLDDIRKLLIWDDKLSVETTNATPLLYAVDDIEKLSFSGEPSNINDVEQYLFNVVAYFTTEGELFVESSADILSLTLYGIDGRIVPARNVPAGIYIVRVETLQGTVVKKIVNNNNK